MLLRGRLLFLLFRDGGNAVQREGICTLFGSRCQKICFDPENTLTNVRKDLVGGIYHDILDLKQ
jgi:hypothetical protein